MLPTSIPGFSDPISSFTHLFIGVPIFVIMTFVLLWRGRGDTPRMITLGIYGLSNILLFTMSGVYHLLDRESTARHVLQRLDHAAIFLLIAGTFTPTHYILFRGWKRWGPIVFVWIAAIIGITLKSIYFNDLSEFLSLSLYLGLGWIGVISAYFIWYAYGYEHCNPLIWGALSYTIGAVLDYLQYPIIIPGIFGGHELFHIGVLLGAGWFCFFVYQIAPGNWQRVRREVQPVPDNPG
jgi:channel protein (hemolysin III family)